MKKTKDVIIIGGGPAGITAGIYAARKNLDGLLLTKDFMGQLGNAGVIENWPGEKSIQGPELLNNFKEHLENYSFPFKEVKVASIEKKESFFEVKSESDTYLSKAVIVATGRNSRPLKVPGEKEFVGKGVSYCVTCDGALFNGKVVVVVGGGNSGLEGALELSEYAKEVKLLEIAKKPIADEFLVERAKKRKNIEIMTETKLEEIKGDDFVNEVICKDIKEDKQFSIKTEGVFAQIGSIPTTDLLNDIVDYNEGGEVIVDPKTCQTKTEGLFAAGDVTDVLVKQIIVAAGEGCKALISAYEYIKMKYD